MRWLFDSGATLSAVDPHFLSTLSLGVPDFALIGVASVSPLGLSPVYRITVTVVHPSNDPRQNLLLSDHRVLEMPLAALGYDGVIGRDVLDQTLFIHNGPAGAFTFAY